MPPFTNRQIEIINGCLLGNGCIVNPKSGNCCFRIDCSIKNKEYLIEISKELGEYFINLSDYRPNKYPYSVLLTKKCPEWNKLRQIWYPDNKKKVVPYDLELTPLTLSHYYCQRGSNCEGAIHLSTCNSIGNAEIIEVKLLKKFNIKTNIQNHKIPRLYVQSNSYLDFLEIVKPCIAYKCFQHLIRNTGPNRHNTMGGRFISPEGELYDVDNVAEFAKEHGLNKANLCDLQKGYLKSHKGW